MEIIFKEHSKEDLNIVILGFTKDCIHLKYLQITDDSRLEVRTAISTVESSLADISQRMSSLTQLWEAWQQHVISSKQFKSQWHQFIQDARKVCHLLVAWIDIVIVHQNFLSIAKYCLFKAFQKYNLVNSRLYVIQESRILMQLTYLLKKCFKERKF